MFCSNFLFGRPNVTSASLQGINKRTSWQDYLQWNSLIFKANWQRNQLYLLTSEWRSRNIIFWQEFKSKDVTDEPCVCVLIWSPLVQTLRSDTHHQFIVKKANSYILNCTSTTGSVEKLSSCFSRLFYSLSPMSGPFASCDQDVGCKSTHVIYVFRYSTYQRQNLNEAVYTSRCIQLACCTSDLRACVTHRVEEGNGMLARSLPSLKTHTHSHNTLHNC